jgi:octaprenyl-diphosphate synthase
MQSQVQATAEAFTLVRPDLEAVEAELAELLSSEFQLIDRLGRYLREGGGKRVRPALLVLTTRLFSGDGPLPAGSVRLAAVMEMLHTATLVHDDIIDDAETRRGKPSVRASWGNEVSVLMGDWLYMKAFEVTLGHRNFDILDVLTAMTRGMTEGEIFQLDLIGSLDVSEEQHFEIVRRKTAYMFRACTEIGAILGNATAAERSALAEFGLNAGVAFQLVDDVLDFVSSEDKLGKPVANDVREGKLTLPLIYLMEQGERRHRTMVEAVVAEGGFVSVARDEILDLVERNGTLERARSEARRYATEAVRCLQVAPCNAYREALAALPSFIVEREM